MQYLQDRFSSSSVYLHLEINSYLVREKVAILAQYSLLINCSCLELLQNV